MAYALVIGVVLAGTILTLFSGFGLGTLLLPVFLLFFAPELAIPAVAIVHFSSSLFKFVLVRKHVDVAILLRFGIPAVLAAWVGSLAMQQLGSLPVIFSWSLGDQQFESEGISFVIGLLIIVFTWFENQTFFSIKNPGEKHLFLGGFLSGFFGGLSGHQGALRSLFLKQTPLSKEGLVATSTAISLGIDLMRIGIYLSAIRFSVLAEHQHGMLIIWGVAAAFTGAVLGNQLLKKLTLHLLQRIISICLMLFGMLMVLGVI